jgi:hypothetical protein
MPSHSLTLGAVVLLIPQTGPSVVCTVVPGAHVGACAVAALDEGTAETTAMRPTVTATTATADPSSRGCHPSNLMNRLPLCHIVVERNTAGRRQTSPCGPSSLSADFVILTL